MNKNTLHIFKGISLVPGLESLLGDVGREIRQELRPIWEQLFVRLRKRKLVFIIEWSSK